MHGPHLDPVLGHERGRDVVLRRQRVRGAQRHARAAGEQRADQIRGLGGDVQAGGDADVRQRLLGVEPGSDLREHRHLLVGPRDPRLALGGEAQVGYVMRRDGHRIGVWGVCAVRR